MDSLTLNFKFRFLRAAVDPALILLRDRKGDRWLSRAPHHARNFILIGGGRNWSVLRIEIAGVSGKIAHETQSQRPVILF